MIGKIFHERYEILEVLGNGGTSIVYKGRDILLNRLVTIKILREQYANDEQFVRRFRHEAQAVACLSHPNIVSIYDVVFDEDSHYLVMEYVEGCSLREYIEKNGLLPMELSLRIAAQLLSALEHAHEHHVIHRDIKPHNILLDTNLNVKVTDFGIAVAISDITQTYNKEVMGSVHYMSPEQVKGNKVTEASDIYSAGVVLYELLTGIQPFQGENAIGVAMQHIQGDILPPHKINPKIPVELSFVVMKAMRKDAELRYESAGEMLEALKKVHLYRNQHSADGLSSAGGKNYSTLSPTVDAQKTGRVKNHLPEDLDLLPEEEEYYEDELPKAKRRKVKSNKGNQKSGRQSKFFANGRPTKAGIIAIILAVVGIVAVVSIISILFSIFGGSKDIEVPEVEGKPLETAEQLLEAAQIDYSITRVEDDEVEENYVISQSVPAGEKIQEGHILELTVSDGDMLIAVPDVEGDTVETATRRLERVELEVRTEEVYHDSVAAGIVIRQSPEADEEVEIGTEITLQVSKGQQKTMTTMPTLTGLTFDQAKAKLAESKLILGSTSKKESTEYVADIVLEQSVAAGSSVEEGASINLVLSDGPGPTPSKAKVTYTLPDTGQEHNVRIVVIDTKGSHEEYNQNHMGGETVTEEVPFYSKGKVQILLDGEVVDVYKRQLLLLRSAWLHMRWGMPFRMQNLMRLCVGVLPLYRWPTWAIMLLGLS